MLYVIIEKQICLNRASILPHKIDISAKVYSFFFKCIRIFPNELGGYPVYPLPSLRFESFIPPLVGGGGVSGIPPLRLPEISLLTHF